MNRVFSKEHEGFSTRHQKSYSMTKFGEQAAWHKAKEAFEYIEKTGEFPSDIELPAGALVPPLNSRLAGKARPTKATGPNSNRQASVAGAMDMVTRSATASARARSFLPPSFQGESGFKGGDLMSAYQQKDVNYDLLPVPEASSPYSNHQQAYNSSFHPPTYMPSNQTLEHTNELTNRMMTFLRSGGLASNPTEAQYLNTFHEALQQAQLDIMTGAPIPKDKELGIWGQPPPYAMNLVNYNPAEDLSNKTDMQDIWAPVPMPQLQCFHEELYSYPEKDNANNHYQLDAPALHAHIPKPYHQDLK